MGKRNYNKNFSLFYNEHLTGFSEKMANYYLSFSIQKGIQKKTLLDLMCGPGKLMNIFQKDNWSVYGIDMSDSMIELAKKNTQLDNSFLMNDDVFSLSTKEKYSLVTCTADGINHIPFTKDMVILFKKIYESLSEPGYFLFDMNTKKGVVDNDYYVSSDDEDGLIIRIGLTDEENGIGYTKFKGYFHYNDEYKPFESIIHNYIYDMKYIKESLHDAGFKKIEILNAKNLSDGVQSFDGAEEFKRVVFIAQK